MDPPRQTITIRCRALAHGGAAVGTAVEDPDTRTWFVQGALPGELVDVEPEHDARTWRRGRVIRILEASPERVRPPCPIADECGGCGWQHVDPRAQGRLKASIVRDQLRGLIESDREIRFVTGDALGYRRRAKMHYQRSEGGLRLGFRRARSHELVDVRTCPVLLPALDRGLQRVRGLADVLPPSGNVLAISDGRAVVLGLPGIRPEGPIVDRAQELLDDEIVGVVIRGGRQRRTVGRGTLPLTVGRGLPAVEGSPFTFAQAHSTLDAGLVHHVAAVARVGGLRVLELHAGVGTFTRALAREARRVWTADEERESVKLLRQLTEDHGLSINAKHGNAERLLDKLAASQTRYDVVVLDPPRRGIGEAAASALARVAGERIVYVSCDPSTLARDLRILVANHWRLADVTIFDLMPMTPEVEVVAVLERGEVV